MAFIGSGFQEAAGGDSNTEKVSEVMLLYSDREHTGYNWTVSSVAFYDINTIPII